LVLITSVLPIVVWCGVLLVGLLIEGTRIWRSGSKQGAPPCRQS